MARGETPTEKVASATPVEPAPDSGELALEALAAGILARTIKPRVADIRRLAEGVLAANDKPAKKKKKSGKKDGGKKRKLSKIPGQKDGR
jgi:hypothetical protein